MWYLIHTIITGIHGLRGFGRPLCSRLLAAGKRTVVLASRCDLVTEALARLLSGITEVLSRLTIRKASGKMADIIEGSRVFFTDGGPIYVCIGYVAVAVLDRGRWGLGPPPVFSQAPPLFGEPFPNQLSLAAPTKRYPKTSMSLQLCSASQNH